LHALPEKKNDLDRIIMAWMMRQAIPPSIPVKKEVKKAEVKEVEGKKEVPDNKDDPDEDDSIEIEWS
jgi:hypothetical protein